MISVAALMLFQLKLTSLSSDTYCNIVWYFYIIISYDTMCYNMLYHVGWHRVTWYYILWHHIIFFTDRPLTISNSSVSWLKRTHNIFRTLDHILQLWCYLSNWKLTSSDLLFLYTLHFRKVSIDRKGVDVNAIGSDPRTDGTHTRS